MVQPLAADGGAAPLSFRGAPLARARNDDGRRDIRFCIDTGVLPDGASHFGKTENHSSLFNPISTVHGVVFRF
jgi:hypothetical protein